MTAEGHRQGMCLNKHVSAVETETFKCADSLLLLCSAALALN